MEKGMLPPGFEPGSPARKAGMIGRTTPREQPLLGVSETALKILG